MNANIYNKEGNQLIRQEELTPICNVDFCDRCGDCLRCNWDGPCIMRHDEHFWVIYGEEELNQRKEKERQ